MAEAKICGLRRPEDVAAAVAAGAAMVGAIVVAGTKRAVPVEGLPSLLAPAAGRATRVAVTVDADDALLDALAATGALDLLQLHGHEPPARVAEVRARTGLGAIKTLAVATAADTADASRYAAVADRILFDAKPPAGAPPGGNGLAFDWRLLAAVGRDLPAGWGLAGGLDPANVAEAAMLTGAAWVDVASGVETAPGVKDHAAIRAFVARAGAAEQEGDA